MTRRHTLLLLVIVSALLAARFALQYRNEMRPAAAAAATPRSLAQETKTKAQPGSNPRAGQVRIGEFMGIQSCASDRCHGGAQDAAEYWQKSYSLWLKGHAGRGDRPADPHQQAYLQLGSFDADSAGYRIVSRVAPQAVKDERSYRQFLAARCDGCHITQAPADAAAPAYTFGVSCESCHGPAGGWLVEHTTRSWLTMDQQEKIRRQFRPLQDLAQRADTCVGCHVGHPAGTELEVDHDLIAAGHPRLNFDLRTYHHYLPEHWDRSADQTRVLQADSRASFQLAIWQAGRAAEFGRALDILAARAARAQRSPERPWPEFSDFSCYACHHQLAGGGSRQLLRRRSHSSGQLDWESWHACYSEFLPSSVQKPLEQLAAELNSAWPNAAVVQSLCDTIREQLAGGSIDADPPTLQQRLASDDYALMDWDRAQRWWSAWLAATDNSAAAVGEPLREEMEATFFRTELSAGPMKDREYSGILELRFQSPVHYDAAAFEQLRRRILDSRP